MTAHPPDACHVCGRHATGIGLAAKPDNRWLCAECLPLLEYVKDIRRMDAYEIKAREGGMEAAAPLVEQFGSDLAEWSEEQVLQFCGAVWRGCADRVRKLIREGDAPW